MSETVEKAVTALQKRMEGKSLPGSVRFVIADEGSVHIDGAEVSAIDAPADTTLTAGADVFERILDGDLDPTTAFMSGQLRIEGDMGLAMKLASLL